MAEIDRAMIVNWALADLGLPPSFSIDGETELGGTVDLVWPRVVDTAFSLHDWTFCRRTYELARLEAAPSTGYAHAFALPANRLGEPLGYFADARCRRPIREFTLEGGEVHMNEAACFARCRVEVDPRDWEPGFRAAFVAALAAELAVPLLQDAELAAQKRAEAWGTPAQGLAGGRFGRLIAQNRAADPPRSPFARSDPLIEARWE